MQYNFDERRERKGTGSVKWEYLQTGKDPEKWVGRAEYPGRDCILPMWVADMDFPSPMPVVEALKDRASHGIFGYTVPGESYYRAVTEWFGRRQNWQIDPKWICVTPGVVPALNMLVRTFTSPGDRVLIQRPVYYPFFSAIENNGCSIENNPLLYDNNRYSMDFNDLEMKTRDSAVKLAILRSPHNPVGRVWTEEELNRFGDICLGNNVLIVSDEIHGDLTYRGSRFIPFSGMSEQFRENSIICTAPSKTFNLAGLQTSNIIIPNEEYRKRFKKTLHSNGIFGISLFGQTALEAAYTRGEEWLKQVMEYIEKNLDYLKDFVSRNLRGIEVVPPEGTYLVWLDCRGLSLDKWELKKIMLEKAGVYFDEGFIFGPEGEGFERINIACPRGILSEALERIEKVLE